MRKFHTICIALWLLLLSAAAASAQTATMPDTCIKVPNTLSINSDPKLRIHFGCGITAFKFRLYDRWAKEVYQTTQMTSPLDLNIFEKINKDGKEIYKYPSGAYFWIAEFGSGTLKGDAKGSINIISD